MSLFPFTPSPLWPLTGYLAQLVGQKSALGAGQLLQVRKVAQDAGLADGLLLCHDIYVIWLGCLFFVQ